MYNSSNKYIKLVVVLATVCSTVSKSITKPEDVSTLTMTYLGSVDGKSYFAEPDPVRSWNLAKEACETVGMPLATITSEVQAIFLKDAYNSSTFTGDYWTSGRDALSLQQMAWDHNSKAPTVNPFWLYVGVGIQSCLAFHASQSNTHLNILPCGHYHRTLCEIVH